MLCDAGTLNATAVYAAAWTMNHVKSVLLLGASFVRRYAGVHAMGSRAFTPPCLIAGR
jgi:hypothetical protein